VRLFFFAFAISCGSPNDTSESKTVTVYTALDQIYSEPIIKKFETKTGIKVEAVYDAEAVKTVGLVNRLIAERNRPRCDVFWNNEIIRTLHLKDEGLLAAYAPPSAATIPANFKDPEGHWTGFAARARVIVYNTTLVPAADAPRDLESLTLPQWRGKVAIAYPLFGSTSTHSAVLFAQWGEERAKKFFETLKANEARVVDGNMTAARLVATGEIPLALTDTDDAQLLKSQGHPIEMIMLDHGGEGALLIPNTLSLVNGAPNPDAAKKLMDYLLSPEVEAALAACESAQIPLHPNVPAPPLVAAMAAEKFWPVDFAKAESQLDSAMNWLKQIFSQP